MRQVIKVAGLIFTGLFLLFWGVLSWQVLSSKTEVEVGTLVNVISGTLAVTVASSTAAWLGIEIQKMGDDFKATLGPGGSVPSWGKRAWAVLTRGDVVTFACWAYMVVAVIVLLLAAFKPTAAPEMYETFALSALGWLAGAFAAAKPPTNDPAVYLKQSTVTALVSARNEIAAGEADSAALAGGQTAQVIGNEPNPPAAP